MNLRSLGILCGCVLYATSAQAQQPTKIKTAVIDDGESQVQRIVIVNGTQTQVRYVGGKSLSASEISLLRELEQAETELAASRQAEQDRIEAAGREDREAREKADIRMKVLRAAASMPTMSTKTSFSETPQVGNAITNFLTPFTFQGYPSSGGGGFGGINSQGGTTLTAAIPSAAAPKTVGGAPVNNGVGTASGQSPIAISNGTTALNNGNNNLNNGGFFNGGGGYYPLYPPQMNAPAQTPVQTTVVTENSVNTKGLEIAAQLATSTGTAKNSAEMMASSAALVKAESNYQSVLSRMNQSDMLRTAVNGQKSKAAIVVAGIPDVVIGASLEVTYKGADKTEKVEGQLVRDDGMYLVVRTTGGRLSIQKSQIVNVLVKE